MATQDPPPKGEMDGGDVPGDGRPGRPPPEQQGPAEALRPAAAVAASAAPPALGEDHDEVELRRAAARLSLWQSLGRASRQLIYSIVMRSGGEPFGAPFELGLQSLTEKMVRRFSQHSFFAFEALEKVELRGRRNKFTRHGAAPYRGAYRQAQVAAGDGRRPRGFLGRLAWRRRR